MRYFSPKSENYRFVVKIKAKMFWVQFPGRAVKIYGIIKNYSFVFYLCMPFFKKKTCPYLINVWKYIRMYLKP